MLALAILRIGMALQHAGENLEMFAVRRMSLRSQIEWFQVWEHRAASWTRVANVIQRGKP